MQITQKQKKIILVTVVALALISIPFLINNNSKDTGADNILPGILDGSEADNGDTTAENGQDSGLKEFDKEEYTRIMNLASVAFNQGKYAESIDYYKQALKMEELDVVYAKMYSSYMAMKDYTNASSALNKARELNPSFNQYWIWTIEMKRSVYNASYSELSSIYKEGIDKVELTAKVNFVTFFATVSEEMGQNKKAIELWQYAIELNPKKSSIYQAEINRLKAL